MGVAQDQHAALVRVLVLGEASIHPLFGPIGRSHRAVDIAPVDLHLTAQGRLVALYHQAFTQLVHQHEGGFVLHIQIPAQLQRRKPLHRIGIDRDSAEIDLQR